MNIDLMGSETPNDSDIANAMQMIIDRKYTAAQREQINARGTVAQKGVLAKFFKGMTAVKIQIIADRDLLRATLTHEAAVTRIAEPTLDPLGKLLYPDGEMGSPMVTNPAIIRDTDERKAAQATIKGATPEVVALFTQRDAARVAAMKGKLGSTMVTNPAIVRNTDAQTSAQATVNAV